MKFSHSIYLVVLILLQFACSNSYVDEIDRSGGYQFMPGFPEVRLVTAGIVDEYTDSTYVILTADIVYSSLVYKKVGDKFRADIALEIQILDLSNPDNIIQTQNYPLVIENSNQLLIRSQEEYMFQKKLDLPSGEYQINFSVTDLSNNRQTIRSAEAYIPDPTDEISHITNIQIYSKDETYSNEFDPITTYDISNQSDSIKFIFQVTNNKPDNPIVVDSRLIRFRSDTTIARSMSFPNYNNSHISFKGIDYDKYEEISSSRRILSQPGSVSIEFYFPGLQRGNYRFEIKINADEEDELYKAREFSIKSLNYPSLKTPKELAAPLYYLMDRKEYERLMSIEDDVELKKAIDRFWLKNLKNSRKAQNIISLYYQRVEEANKQFSNFKEGWKTDMGMMYILFGPPWSVYQSVERVHWSYSYNSSDFEKNFYFFPPKLKNKYFPFDSFLLIRNQQYFSIQYQQIQKWLSGTIVRDNL